MEESDAKTCSIVVDIKRENKEDVPVNLLYPSYEVKEMNIESDVLQPVVPTAAARMDIPKFVKNNDIDMDQLISLVRARPVLWDKSLEEYKYKNISNAAWKDVCMILYSDFESLDVKDKDVFGSNTMQIEIEIKQEPADLETACKEIPQFAGYSLNQGQDSDDSCVNREIKMEIFTVPVPGDGTPCSEALARLEHSSANYELHYKRLQNGERPFQCDVCYKRFPLNHRLMAHKRIHTGEKRYRCEICDKQFTWRNSLEFHKLSHEKEKPFQCEICRKNFSRKEYLSRHQQVHTREKTPFKCGVCLLEFALEEYLIRHQRIHSRKKPNRARVGKNPYKCGMCQRLVSNKTDFERHKLLHLL